MEQEFKELTTEQKLLLDEREKALLEKNEKLKQKMALDAKRVALNNKKLNAIKTKKESSDRKERNHKLICTGAIADMVDSDFIDVKNNSTMYRLVLGSFLRLKKNLNNQTHEDKMELAELEREAKLFLQSRQDLGDSNE